MKNNKVTLVLENYVILNLKKKRYSRKKLFILQTKYLISLILK